MNGATPTACDGSCSGKGCARAGTCQTCTGQPYCHLCKDVECEACTTYEACTSAKCSSKTTQSTGDCSCAEGFFRSGNNVDLPCLPCYANCKVCGTGDLKDYSDCTECMDNAFDQDTAAKFYCSTFCPTHFTGAAKACTLSTASQELILNYKFAADITNGVVDNTGFAGASLDGALTKADPSGTYAERKGMYFDGTANGYISLQNKLSLNPTFSIHAWINCTEAAGVVTLFSKYKSPWNKHIRLGFNALKWEVELAKDSDHTAVTKETTEVIVINTWTYVVFSVELDTNVVDTDIKLYKDNGSVITTITTFSGYFLVDPASYPAYIGIGQSAANTFAQRWKGYIYEFIIYQKATTGLAEHYKTASCAESASSCPADLAKLCAENEDLTYCKICDATCTNCNMAGADKCLACHSNASVASAPGACVCDVQWYPNTTSKDCAACSTKCNACSTTGDDKCTSCRAGAALTGTAPATCACSDGWAGTADSCLACHGSCATCSVGSNAAKCKTCINLATHDGASDGERTCTCNGGYWFKTSVTPNICAPCHANCATCSADLTSTCHTCKTNATKPEADGVNGTCVCTAAEGKFGTPDNC